MNAELAPQPCDQHHDFGIDVRTIEAKAFDIELAELTITAFLRALMTEHLAHRIDAHWPVVDEVRLNCCAYQARSQLRP